MWRYLHERHFWIMIHCFPSQDRQAVYNAAGGLGEVRRWCTICVGGKKGQTKSSKQNNEYCVWPEDSEGRRVKEVRWCLTGLTHAINSQAKECPQKHAAFQMFMVQGGCINLLNFRSDIILSSQSPRWNTAKEMWRVVSSVIESVLSFNKGVCADWRVGCSNIIMQI